MTKINRISPEKHKYLQIVSHIAKKPEKLYFIGTLPDTRVPTVAIVGTRKPTAYGREVTTRLASDLAQKGVVIMSGLALGVDTIAHKAALEVGGTTIAVLANGLPGIYPASNRQLASDIVAHAGAILSEYEPDTPARQYRFLERNRIVSGLSDAIVITEASARSGTMSTAARALEQGKEVFVVPGNITSPMSSGCNALLKQGATPVTSYEDILQVIAPELLQKQSTLALGHTELESNIIKLLQEGVRDGDELLQRLAVDITELSTTLTMMEITGSIRSLGANQWTIR